MYGGVFHSTGCLQCGLSGGVIGSINVINLLIDLGFN